MAEKKKSSTKRAPAKRGNQNSSKRSSEAKRTSPEEENRVRREISGIIITALGILLGLFSYFRMPGLLAKIVPAFFGVFGIAMYAVPVLLVAFGIYIIASSKKKLRIAQIICGFIIIFSLLSLIHIITVSPSLKENGGIDKITFGKFISDAYKTGSQKSGGGFLGSFTAYPLLKLAGIAGSIVILIAVIIICIIVITHISIKATAKKLHKHSIEKHEAREKNRRNDIGIQYAGGSEKGSLKGRSKNNESDDSDFMKHSGKPLTAGDSAYGYGPDETEYRIHPAAKSRNAKKTKHHSSDELELYPISGSFENGRSAHRHKKGKELDWDPGIVGGLNPNEADSTADGIGNFEIPINVYNASGASGNTEDEPVSLVESEEEAENKAAEKAENAADTAQNETSDEAAPEFPITHETADIPEAGKPKAGTKSDAAAKSAAVSGPGENKITTDVPPAVWEYQRPPFSLLKSPDPASAAATESPNEKARILLKTLESFHIQARIINISIGPVITRFELQPAQGIRVSKITALSNDIALALAASRVRIEAPIPGKSAIGIEVPNKEVAPVLLREVLETREFSAAKSPLTFALGKDIAGNVVLADLEKMPHMLIAGQTGSGKSVCINGIILSLLYKSSPKDVRMILIDPKVVELSVFAPLPHLFCPIVTEPKKANGALKWAVNEMEQRYAKMGKVNARDIHRYNALQKNEDDRWPRIVIIIDELSDLMMVASKDVEESICRIAQLGRACGIHLIVATQRPSVDVITGLIKANIPSRIAFAVSSLMDSRVILDMAGAEKLLGRGDMLFHANGAHKPIRAQGAFISDEEVEAVMDFFTQHTQGVPAYEKSVVTEINMASAAPRQGAGKQEDELLPDAARIFIDSGTASISMLQRKLRVGYARAARLVDIMEKLHYVSEPDGAKPRKVLIDAAEYERAFGSGQQGQDDASDDDGQF